MTKQRRVYLFGSPFSLWRKEGWPSRYSKTVALAKPTVSRSKRNSEAGTLARAKATATDTLNQQKPADVRQWPRITSKGCGSGCAFAFGENAEPAKFFVAFLWQFINRKLGDVLQIPAQCAAQIFRDRIIVPVRAAFRFGDDFVDHFEFQQILRRQLKRLGRFGSMPPVSPQNRGTRFRTDHRIVSVL